SVSWPGRSVAESRIARHTSEPPLRGDAWPNRSGLLRILGALAAQDLLFRLANRISRCSRVFTQGDVRQQGLAPLTMADSCMGGLSRCGRYVVARPRYGTSFGGGRRDSPDGLCGRIYLDEESLDVAAL